jgi:hypothetical protein
MYNMAIRVVEFSNRGYKIRIVIWKHNPPGLDRVNWSAKIWGRGHASMFFY